MNYDVDGTQLWVNAEPLVTDATVKRAHHGVDSVTGQDTVILQLTPAGSRILADFATNHVGGRIAYILDDKVLAAAIIRDKIEGDEVELVSPKIDATIAERIAARIELLVKRRTNVS